MVKTIAKIIFLATTVVLVGCASQTPTVVYKDKDVPVYITPTPPKVERPVLAITELTDAQKEDQGELTKAYVISLKQAMQYACRLNNIVLKYAELAANSPVPVVTPTALAAGDSTALSLDVDKDCKNP